MVRSIASAIALMIGVTPAATPVVAQTTLMGIVADTSKTPLQGVEVLALKSGLMATSNAEGIFLIPGLPAGHEEFQVRRIGFKGQKFSAELSGSDTLQIGVILEPAAQLLPEIGVEARGKVYTGLMAGFADRMLNSGAPPSSFVTREDLEKSGKIRLIDVIQQAGMRTEIGSEGKRVPRCPRGYTGLPRVPTIFLNGGRVFGQIDIDNLAVDQVEALEVYKTPIETPSQFSRDSGCVIVIWTRGAAGRNDGA